MSGRHAIHRLISFLLAPGLCYACGCALEDSNTLCCGCIARLKRVPNPCAACGEPNPSTGDVCARCLLNPPRWQKLIAPFQYRGLVRKYLLQLKFADAPYLARTMVESALAPPASGPHLPEVLIPVPLHSSRFIERGYNQAHEIACVWSSQLHIPVAPRALRRTRATASQSGLSAAKRAANLRGAFVYRSQRQYRHVALVDDIVTTGATVDEITRVLHRAGVEYVEVWALARVYRD